MPLMTGPIRVTNIPQPAPQPAISQMVDPRYQAANIQNRPAMVTELVLLI